MHYIIEFFIACTILGLEYIHQEQVLHRDIKPENLVLDQKGYVHITDFGIAKRYQPNNARDTSGTIGYMAPEVLNNENHGYSSDYYAVGIIAYEFLFGHRPYLAKSKRELKELILTRQAQVDIEELPNGWSSEAADFINQLIQRKPKNRLGINSIDDIKAHPWFYNYEWDKLEKRIMKSPLIPKKGDNFDRKYCTAADKIGNDTMERYKQYMLDASYEDKFKKFSSEFIPDELRKGNTSILATQSLYNLSDISTSLNSHQTLNVNNNNNLQRTSRNKKENNGNVSKHLSVGSLGTKNQDNTGNSKKKSNSINKQKENDKGISEYNLLNDELLHKIDAKLKSSNNRQRNSRGAFPNQNIISNHQGSNNVLKNSAIFFGTNKNYGSSSLSKDKKSLSSSNSLKLLPQYNPNRLIFEKKLPVINLSFSKKKSSLKQDFSFSQLSHLSQLSDRKSNKGKIRNKFFNLNQFYSNNNNNNNISVHHGNNVLNNSMNRSMYHGYKVNKDGRKTINKSMSPLSYYYG